MKFKIVYITVLLFSVIAFAQVGIGTENPRPEVGLDVSGTINVVDRIYIGSSNLTQPGDDGENKDVIISSGSLTAAEWGEKRIPAGFGQSFSMTYMNTYYDTTGRNLTTTASLPYFLDDVMDANWLVLTGLNNSFTVYKSGNKANFMFQTTAQINSAVLSSFACGLFLNSPSNPTVFTLKGVRTDIIFGASIGDYKMFNMNVTLENLPVPGGAGGTVYQARVACRGRLVQSDAFAVGKPVNTTHLNQDMAQSTLSVFVLEDW